MGSAVHLDGQEERILDSGCLGWLPDKTAGYFEAEMEDGGNGDDIEEATLSQHELTGPEEVPVNGDGPVPEDLGEEAAITEICGLNFSRKYSLKRHMSRKH